MASRSIFAFAESVTVAELEKDPYPIYARLRREAPVCFIPAVGLWFVTRYDDVEFVGTRPELFSAQLDDSPVDRTFGSPTIITVDGEPHRDLRRALDAKYRPRHVNAYIDGLVRPIACDLLDGLDGGDRAELMADYLEPLSVLSLGSVLGVAHLGAAQLRDWCQVNIAFGTGRHFCAGHAFSRALIKIAIEELLQRFPRLALDPQRPPEFRGWEFRAPRRLDVLLS
jgi:cytochrome P450